jgi:dipeptidyl aminopeptidase/acylaminoacyl peptidase/CubicO group peptidase (beta-lactamase class C family)
VTRRLRIDDLTAVATPEQPALSPDGQRCVYVLRTADAAADRSVRALWSVGARDGQPRPLTRGKADVSPAWSPEGDRIAFLRAQDGPAQLWLLPADAGEAEQLTTLPMGAGAPVWSPDGQRIAFTAPVDTLAGTDANAPIVTTRLDYRADGAGLLRGIRTHLHVLDLASGACRQVTEGDWHAGQPAWSPDGTKLAFPAATAPDADVRPRVPVHVVDVTAAVPTVSTVGLADGIAGTVAWTADGGALLVVGYLGEPVGHVRLLRVPLDGGQVVDLAAALDRNVMAGGPAYPGALPQLVDDGRTVLFCVRDRGATHLYSVPVDGGRPLPVVAGAGHVVSGLSVAAGSAAVVLATPTSFGELAVVDLASGERSVRTRHGEALADVEWFAREEREFTVSDGTVVPAWLIRDPAATGPTPLLLDIHGGPHNAWNAAADEVHLYHQELVAQGWSVLLVNPRASDGYGTAFFTGAVGGWGTADAKDFLEPVDALVAEGLADPDRLAVAGYSYGGYMTCYLTSRDARFAAAVAGGVVGDLASMAGTSDEGHFLARYELGGAPWERPAEYAAMSPFAQVDKVTTPTLVLQGADDIRCPIGQAQQWHGALRERGVPAELVLYPGGSHLFIVEGPLSHRADYNRRIISWLEEHVTVGKPAIDQAHWQRRLTALATRHKVPGAVLGILRVRPDGGADELAQAAHGVLNVETGVAATTDAVFQIGSISKVWTATVVLQLVDEGKLDLDAPLVEYLPELRLADADVTKHVTMRHLLNHTSGIDGDVFTDYGRGDDCLEKYVAGLADVAQNHPLGATWSYCNSGFSLAGRVIEKITGQTWDQAMRERVFGPLGLRRTVTLPEEALLLPAAVGHVGEDEGEITKAPIWMLPRTLGPAGLICSTPADVLTFARAHLAGGAIAGGEDGKRLLSEDSAVAMAAKEADLPDKYSLGDSWGLGWIRFDWDGHRLIGHDGNTIGQAAFLRILPEQGLAVTLLTNGGHTRDLYQDLYREIFAELADVEMPTPLGPPAEPVDVAIGGHAGTYERAGCLMDVLDTADGPVLKVTITGPLAQLVPEQSKEYPMTPVNADLWLVREPEAQTWSPITFYALPTGERYLHFGVRATPKVA